MISSLLSGAELPTSDVCIVGGGPVGIALALACETAGLSVLLLESGLDRDNVQKAALSASVVTNVARHAPTTVANRRALGGTSRWWGGRCVPYDDVDFSDRVHLPSARWPISHDEIAPYYLPAADFFGISQSAFQTVSCLNLRNASFQALERWAPVPDCHAKYSQHLEASRRITVLLDSTVTDLDLGEGDRVRSIVLSSGGERRSIPVTRLILCCGGLETTRLLLNAQTKMPNAFGGPSGALGRYYAGHISGKIADLVLDDPATVVQHDYFIEGMNYARRRFQLNAKTQHDHGLLNAAFWVDNPPFYDWTHRNGVLSLVWLAISVPWVGRRVLSEGVRLSHVGPGPYRPSRHLLNVARHPFATLWNGAKVIRDRLLGKPRRPGFLLHSQTGRYPLHYHAEQTPSPASTVSLSGEVDALGMGRLLIDFQYSEQNAVSVVESHAILDQSLRAAGVGRLEYKYDLAELRQRVLDQATDGFHQTGTTRMGEDPATSVVDADARVHGFENLYIASSSIFPSAGQANPTFLAVAFAFRLAEHLQRSLRTLTPKGLPS